MSHIKYKAKKCSCVTFKRNENWVNKKIFSLGRTSIDSLPFTLKDWLTFVCSVWHDHSVSQGKTKEALQIRSKKEKIVLKYKTWHLFFYCMWHISASRFRICWISVNFLFLFSTYSPFALQTPGFDLCASACMCRRLVQINSQSEKHKEHCDIIYDATNWATGTPNYVFCNSIFYPWP